MSTFSHPLTQTPSRTLAADTDLSDTNTDFDIDFSSDDDEAGVFFGTPKAVERKIVAALSRSIPATPRDRLPAAGPRRSSLASRVNKRDSREFLRRKTLLLSTPGAGPSGSSGEKVWEGGFHERTPEPEPQLDAVELEVPPMPVAGPSTPSVQTHEDIAVDLDNLRLNAFPSSSDSDHAHHPQDDFFDEEEEDKENSAVPEEWYGDGEEDEDEYIPAPPEHAPMAVGFRADQFDLDLFPQLDMGNLCILDIDDPEDAPFELGNDTGGAPPFSSLGSSTSSARSYDSIASASRACQLLPHSPSPIAGIAPFPPSSESGDDDNGHDGDDETPVEDERIEPETQPAFDQGDDLQDTEPDNSTEFKGARLFETHAAVADAVEISTSEATPIAPPDLEDTLPADGVLTSTTLSAIEAPSGACIDGACTPRPYSPRESLGMFAAFQAPLPTTAAPSARPTFLDETADLISFTPLKPCSSLEAGDTSYASDMDSPMARAPVMIPLFSVASPPLRHQRTPLRETMTVDDLVPLDADIDTAVALPLLDSPGSEESFMPLVSALAASTSTPYRNRSPSKLPVLSPTKAPPADAAKAQKSMARRNAAREHLDSLFLPKIGAPRFVGSTTKPSSQTTERPLANSIRMPAMTVLTSPELPKGKRKAEPKKSLTSTELPMKSLKPSKETELPTRSILKTSKLTTSAARQAATTARLAVPKASALPRPATAPASNLPRPALKRPATQTATRTAKLFRMAPKITRPGEPSLKRPFAATQTAARTGVAVSKPTLGMPSRLVRDPVSGTACFTASASGNGSGSGTLFASPLRSPVKPLMKALSPKAVLSRPVRPTGMTPMASRTMPTPQRGMTPSKQAFKLGTPSRPTTTPMKQRARMMAVSEERRKSMTPIRAEEPPSPPRWSVQRMHVDEPVKAASAEPPLAEPVHAEARVLTSSLSPAMEVDTAPPGMKGTSLSPSDKEKEAPPAKEKEATPPAKEASPPPPEAHSSTDTSPAQPAPSTTADARPERRSMRARTPRHSSPPKPKPKPKTEQPPSIVPGMTERALKAATSRNTARNQVYLCTIDRQIVRVSGERPPSPTPVRTANKEHEEQIQGREARAKRRARASLGESESGEEEVEDEGPDIERATLGRRAPGDLEEYSTPVKRPAKRAKLTKLSYSGSGSSSDGDRASVASRATAPSQNGENNEGQDGDDRRVRWDEGLLIIRRGLGDVRHAHRSTSAQRSCMNPKARYPLDEHGNAVDRPTEKLKRTTIRVNAVFYDGEEPVAFEYNKSASKRKGKK